MQKRIAAILISACGALSGGISAADQSAGESIAPTAFDGMQWRLIGPFRSGWSTMAGGIADEPDTYYSGYAGGGVWKTTDSGRTWRPVFDGQPAAAIGAIAVAPSNPQVIYVGTGQPEQRYDIGSGNGVYRSSDGGASWTSLGLADTRYIGDLHVDPRNADVVMVAALGQLFGENEERGVFRSEDGGKTWTRTLFVDTRTGAVDIAADPADPDHLYASTWTARHWPWLSYFTPLVGPGSYIYESRDNGRNWARIAGAGLPKVDMGRIGLAIGHTAEGTRVYASVIAKGGSGLYRSDDAGAHFSKVNEARAVANPYFSRLTLDPRDPDIVYLTGQSIHKSVDGGHNFTIIRGSPGGDDYHHLWINPKHPERMIAASDQGTIISVNGGETWSSWYNSPTGQFYYLATDNAFPYRVYSGQQDNGTASVPSRSDYGAISFRDWWPVGADERDYDIPDPEDPNIVYGSGLGGRLSRWDRRTGEVQNITPWPVGSYGRRPTDFKHHYTWFTPIAFGELAPHPFYFATQVLFRSLDRGRTWEQISPQLSHHDPSMADCDGDLGLEAAKACGYGVIFSIAPSPLGNDEIWIGTDDGRVQLTRDGGKHWSDISPPGLALWSKISRVEPSRHEAGVAYVAVDNHRINDYEPHVYRTRDYGKTWMDISAGLPAGRFVGVVRADPVRPGLLYAGTDIGVQVSFDDGTHWQALQLNLPPAWVTDLLVHENDVVVATEGRALWILDDIARLRQLEPGALDSTRLFAPSRTVRVRSNQNKDTPLPAETPLGVNPPDGAIIDYVIGPGVKKAVALEIHDSAGRLLRRFSSDDPPEAPVTETRYFPEQWIRPAAQLSAQPGAHRFVWDLRLPRPRAPVYAYSISTSLSHGTPIEPRGPLIPPGRYQLTLLAGGKRYTAPLEVIADPRVPIVAEDLQAALQFSLETGDVLEQAWRAVREIESFRESLASLRGQQNANESLHAMIDELTERTEAWVEGDGEATTNLNDIGELVGGILTDVGGTDRAPTAAQRAVVADRAARVRDIVAAWQSLKAKELPELNRQLRRARLKAITILPAEQVPVHDAEGGEEMP
ncbi:MAG: hypothetical protein R3E77_00660 [Steroidobacteraceae bacterium]